MTDPRLPVVLLWHMHQPPYRDALSGRYVLPWTYLHAIKDYTDMAAHLEQVPGAKAVVNFTPVLIEQIEDLDAAVRNCLRTGARLPDALLATLGPGGLSPYPGQRLLMLRACLRADRETLIRRHPPFEELFLLAQTFATPERILRIGPVPVRPVGLVPHRMDGRIGASRGCARRGSDTQ